MNLAATIELYAGGLGSGCRGSNCGRGKLLYHGTDKANLSSIKKLGLIPQKSLGHYTGEKWEEGKVFLTESKEVARKYADKYSDSPIVGHGPAVVHVLIPEHRLTDLRKLTGEGGSYWLKGKIPANMIQRVERVGR